MRMQNAYCTMMFRKMKYWRITILCLKQNNIFFQEFFFSKICERSIFRNWSWYEDLNPVVASSFSIGNLQRNWVLPQTLNFYSLHPCRRPWFFQTMNSVRSNSLSLKYQRFTSSGCKDKGIRKFEFVAENSIPF